MSRFSVPIVFGTPTFLFGAYFEWQIPFTLSINDSFAFCLASECCYELKTTLMKLHPMMIQIVSLRNLWPFCCRIWKWTFQLRNLINLSSFDICRLSCFWRLRDSKRELEVQSFTPKPDFKSLRENSLKFQTRKLQKALYVNSISTYERQIIKIFKVGTCSKSNFLATSSLCNTNQMFEHRKTALLELNWKTLRVIREDDE